MLLMDITKDAVEHIFWASLTPYNTNKFNYPRDLVVGERWGENELVTVVTGWELSSLQTMLIIAPNPRYRMAMIPTT